MEATNTEQKKQALPYEVLKFAGYNDSEIQDYLRPVLKDNGYTDAQISQYFYTRGPEASAIQRAKQGMHDAPEDLQYYTKQLQQIKSYEDGKNLGPIDAIKLGFKDSIVGMIAMNDKSEPLTVAEEDSLNIIERTLMSGTALLMDAPVFLGGSVIGGAVGSTFSPAGTIPGATIGAFAVHAAARQFLIELYDKGSISSLDDLLSRLDTIDYSDILVETAKGAAIGTAMYGAGLGGQALKGIFAASANPLAQKSAFALPFATEVLGLTTASSAANLEVPTAQSFIDNTLLIGVLRGVHSMPQIGVKALQQKAQAYLYEEFVREGKHPMNASTEVSKDYNKFQSMASKGESIVNGSEAERRTRPRSQRQEIREEQRRGFTATDPEGFNVERIIRKSDIIRNAVRTINEEIANLTVTVGDVPTQAGIQGFQKGGAIRLKETNDLRIFGHEIAHFFDLNTENAFTKQFANNPKIMRELNEVATRGDNVTEGFAEFMARYILNEPLTKKNMPNTYEAFKRIMTQENTVLNGINNVLTNMKSDFTAFQKQPSIYRVGSHISFNPRETENRSAHPNMTRMQEILYNADLGWFDYKAPIKQLVKDINRNILESVNSKNPYSLSLLYGGIGGVQLAFQKYGALRYADGSFMKNAKSFEQIVNKVENIHEFETYLVALRAVEKNAQKIDTGIEMFDAKATVQKLNRKYKDLADELFIYQRAVLNYLKDSGFFSQKDYDNMVEKNKYYIPFQRVNDNGYITEKIGKNKVYSIKYMTGSKKDIYRPLESILRNTYNIVAMAEKNRIARSVADLAKEQGSEMFIERRDMPFDIRDKGKTNDRGISLEKVFEQYNKKVLNELAENEFAVFENGKASVFAVRDPEVAKLIKTMKNQQDVNGILKPLAQLNRVFKAGATTLNLAFAMKNIIFDTGLAIFNSSKGAGILKKYGAAVKSVLKEDEFFQKFMAAGGGHAAFLSLDRFSLNNQLRDIYNSGYADRVWNSVREGRVLDAIDSGILNPLRFASELLENVPRMAEFMATLEGKPHTKDNLMKAALNSRQITIDFAQGGTYSRALNAIYAFFNANILSAKIMANILTDKTKAPKAIAAMGVIGILEALNNYDYDNQQQYLDIQETPEYVKNMFWLLRVPGQQMNIKIPKPRELGMISTAFERVTTNILNKMDGNDTNTILYELAKTGYDTMTGMVNYKQMAVPTALTPVVETITNYDLFLNTKLVPNYLENMLPEYQYKPNTSETAKLISKGLGTIFGKQNIMSPIKLENLVTGYFGALGDQILRLSDVGLKASGISDSSSVYKDSIYNNVFIKGFVARYPNASSASVQKFYDGYTIIRKQSNSEKANGEPNVHGGINKALTKINNNIAKINKTIRNIDANPDMTIDDKRQSIETLWQTIQALSRKGVQMIRDFEKRDDLQR